MTKLRFFISFSIKVGKMCGRTCVVCDQLKNARTHAHRTHIFKAFLHAHAHVRPHIARVRARTHLRNSRLGIFWYLVLVRKNIYSFISLFCLIRPHARSKWCLTAKLSETEGVSGTISSWHFWCTLYLMYTLVVCSANIFLDFKKRSLKTWQ